MNSTSLVFFAAIDWWFLTLGHDSIVCAATIIAPVPQVGQECVRWSVPVRSAHKDCENTHQPKIAACISFLVKNLRNKVKSRMGKERRLKAAIACPRSAALPLPGCTQ